MLIISDQQNNSLEINTSITCESLPLLHTYGLKLIL